jgi:hypothetical protein
VLVSRGHAEMKTPILRRKCLEYNCTVKRNIEHASSTVHCTGTRGVQAHVVLGINDKRIDPPYPAPPGVFLPDVKPKTKTHPWRKGVSACSLRT